MNSDEHSFSQITEQSSPGENILQELDDDEWSLHVIKVPLNNLFSTLTGDNVDWDSMIHILGY